MSGRAPAIRLCSRYRNPCAWSVLRKINSGRVSLPRIDRMIFERVDRGTMSVTIVRLTMADRRVHGLGG